MNHSPFRTLCAAGFLAILSTTMAKNPVLPLFAASLGAGLEGVGLVSALSPLAGVLVSIPGGLCSDAFGRRRMLVASSLVFASAPFAYLLVDSVSGLCAARFYHGLATGIFMPVAQAAVADAHKASRGEKLGTFSSATLAGRFVAPMLGGAALGLGFPAVYVLCGLAGIGVLALAWRLPSFEGGPDAPGNAGRVQDGPPVKSTSAGREPASGPGGQERAAPKACRPPARESLRELLSSRGILAGCGLEAGVLFAYGAFEAFLPIVAMERGHGAWLTGALFSAQIVTVALTKPFFGRFSDRHGRVGHMLGGALLTAGACAAVPWASGLAALFALSILLGLALSIVTSATSAYVADLSRCENRGAAMGILGSVMDVGHSAGPLVAGAAAALAGSAAAFATGALALCLAGFYAWRMSRT